MKSKRRIVLAVAAFFPVAAHVACSATNGEPIPSQVFDASALDVSTTPEDPGPDAETGTDGSTTKKDAESDAPVDAKDAAPNDAPVQINEVFVDNASLGDGAEFIELRSAPGAAADDLKLRLVHSNGQVKYEVTVGQPGATFNGNGIWVVGGSQTFKLNAVPEHVDQQVALASWGLDNDRGTIQVVRGTTLLDVVGYARDPDAGALPPLALPPSATSEGLVATIPAAPTTTPAISRKHRSFGRKNGAVDGNQNATDFCAMEASPGFAQKPCL